MATKSICAIDGCDKPVHNVRGWCNAHYQRWIKYGDPLSGGTLVGAPLKWLLENLNYAGEECLIWPFSRDTKNRGQLWYNGRTRNAARIICEKLHGAPPTPEHEVAHNCGKGHLGCVAGRHLRWATHVENMADCLLHGTSNRGERSGSAKLTESQVMEIRRRGATATHPELAAAFGVARTTIASILQRNSWFWLV